MLRMRKTTYVSKYSLTSSICQVAKINRGIHRTRVNRELLLGLQAAPGSKSRGRRGVGYKPTDSLDKLDSLIQVIKPYDDGWLRKR